MNRPQTPVKGILNNNYGEDAEKYYMAKTLEKKAQRLGQQKPTKLAVKSTKAHQLAADLAKRRYKDGGEQAHKSLSPAQLEFKMRRFSDVQPKIDNKRNAAAAAASKQLGAPTLEKIRPMGEESKGPDTQ